MSKVIGDYSAAISIDGANHFLLIQPGNSSTAYNKISRNVLLGVSAQPVDISSSQTLTNKVLGITNTVTLIDTLFTLQDNSDNTKQALFQLSGITTGTTRTYTLPNVSDTLVSLTASQTLTNKTLTGPAITGGTIDNSTITVDSIAGHSTSTIVTVANMQISNGVINSANAVTSTSIAAGAVQPQALQSGTGSGWSWQSWTPTLANMTGGTINYAKYIQIGKTVYYRFKYTLAGAGISGDVTFTLPVTANSDYGLDVDQFIGDAAFVDSGSQLYRGSVIPSSTTVGKFRQWTTASTSVIGTAALSSSSPFTFGTGDYLLAVGSYEAA